MSVYPHPSPLPLGEGVVENMRIMRQMRQIRGFGGRHLFCIGQSGAKQILEGTFWQKCLMEAHFPHGFDLTPCPSPKGEGRKAKNMRIMRQYEGGLFIGVFFPCGNLGRAEWPKHEAVMREGSSLPHVFGMIGG